MKYTIYKITNLINNKIYIGQHSCSCKECSYLGSGSNILKAIKKYGRKNFKKEILFSFDTFEEMNEKEAEIVNEEFVTRKDTYNLMTGGSSGIPGEEARNKMSESLRGRKLSDEHKANISLCVLGRKVSPETGRKISLKKTGFVHTKESKEKMSSSHRGKILSEIHKEKISNSLKGIIFSDDRRKNISTSLIGKKPSQSTIDKQNFIKNEKSREKLGNRNVLKIDPNTGEILEEFHYVSQTGYCSSNIISGIKLNQKRYGFFWRLGD